MTVAQLIQQLRHMVLEHPDTSNWSIRLGSVRDADDLMIAPHPDGVVYLEPQWTSDAGEPDGNRA